MIRAVCLDLGGTLIDRARHLDLVAYWCRRGVPVDADAAAATLYRADRRFMEHLPALWQEAGAAFHTRYWPEVHAELGLVSPAAEVCAGWGGPWRTYPDALPALDAARRAHLRLALISNWDLSGRDVLRATGLDGVFDVVAFSAEEGCAKPDAGIFTRTARRLGVAPAQCLYVGDNPWDDVAGARAAGMCPVLLHRRPGWCAVPVLAKGATVMATLRDLAAISVGRRAESVAVGIA